MCHVLFLVLFSSLFMWRADAIASDYYERFVRSIETQQKAKNFESTITLSDDSTWTCVVSLDEADTLAGLYDDLEEGRPVGIKGARFKAAYRIWFSEDTKIHSYPVRITNDTRRQLPTVEKVEQVGRAGWFTHAKYHVYLSDGSIWEVNKANDVTSVEFWQEGDQVLVSPSPVHDREYRLINGRRFRSDRQLFNPTLVQPPLPS